MGTSEVVVLVGTAKGAFVMRGDPADPGGSSWTTSGPHLRGVEVDAIAWDPRHRAILAAANSPHFGPGVVRSDDLGSSWTDPAERAVAFPESTGASVARIWQLQPSTEAEPGVVYAGVEPAAIFRSDDGGSSFALIEGLWDHPHRPHWQPGGGGLCLHTIHVDPRDPDNLHIAISAAGVYRTEDGGDSWQASNFGIKVPFLPPEGEPYEFGQCVHKMARDAGDPDRWFLQHHWGIYRSDDDAATWNPVGESLPSDFGFPVVTHPTRPGTAYVIPLTSDEFRCTAEGRCRVYRTSDRGESWDALGEGLPQERAFLTVLRDGFACDGGDPAGLYFGTRSGSVFASGDEGATWAALADHLPAVLCVRAAVLS